GEFWVGEDGPSETEILSAALLRRPSEILVPDSLRANTAAMARLQATGAALTFCDPATFAPRRAAADLCAHFRVESLDPFGVGDLERLASRATLGVAHARDLVGLRACLSPLAQIRRAAEVFDAESIGEACAALSPLDELREFLAAALEDEPPLTLHDGG